MTRFWDDFSYSDPAAAPSWDFGNQMAEAIGEVTINFADLEDDVSAAISFLLKRGDDVGRIVTAELSFKGKLNLVAAVFRHLTPESERLESLRELLGLCLKIEGIRNQVVHSSWIRHVDNPKVIRRKFTAKMRHGFREETEGLAPAQVQDISIYCGYLGWCFDQLLYEEFGEEYGQS